MSAEESTRTTGADTMTVAQAQKYLGISKMKIAQLIAEGVLHAKVDPLDKRSKRILREEVEALRARSGSGGKARVAARKE